MLPTQPLELNADFNRALSLLENSTTSLFITGKAGTGKSTLLRLFRQTTRKQIVVLAPTGVAALNVQGQTIHSFFGFPPFSFDSSQITINRKLKPIANKLEVLIIDEISMVRADILDHMDYSMRKHRKNPLPFGGLQVVFFGDLFQLPPVVAGQQEKELLLANYESPFFFSARLFKDDGFDLQMMELRKVYRQDSRHFLRLLEAVRINEMDYDDLADLNERHQAQFDDHKPGFITLCARNATADDINRRQLAQLATREAVFVGKLEGQFDMKIVPVDYELKLRVDAQVMFCRNDTDGAYVNGTIGVVKALEADKIQIAIEDEKGEEKIIAVAPAKWETVRYNVPPDKPDKIETEVVGSYTQYPVKLAWAVTIHKSQGKTFDKVIIDLGSGAFEHGQVYVALSRCRTLEGVVLRQPIRPRDIITDPRIVTFYEDMR